MVQDAFVTLDEVREGPGSEEPDGADQRGKMTAERERHSQGLAR